MAIEYIVLSRAFRLSRTAEGASISVSVTVNGKGEIHRSVELTLNRQEFYRARRFLLDLRVEDADARVVDAIRNFRIDISDPAGLDKLLLHLNVALNSKD